ncbi:TadE/TadG family type IV pilus assembly protein [Pseudooceanicola nanhaiensis]|uniref:TadE/TadG family type IV pilus assembly protein n=1 Tax=Pseudooceanicola nanhaiensis TaxID=375761 RepID=UPI001CD53938|nr:hypothetical protein [Pseudooceanicola nanhaiensis]MCA0919712.1 hypothetical protein [Pseudooceanicola nanhaiensis]
MTLIQTLGARLRQPLARFARDTRGTVAIEAVVMFPILIWGYLGMFTFYDMVRQYDINEKAAFTVADMLSRETTAIDDTYINGAQTLYEYLARVNDGTAIRISELRWTEDPDYFKVDWSEARGSKTALTDDDVKNWTNILPIMPEDERIILVETWTTYELPFRIGMEDFPIKTFVFVRPRFAPKVTFSS